MAKDRQDVVGKEGDVGGGLGVKDHDVIVGQGGEVGVEAVLGADDGDGQPEFMLQLVALVQLPVDCVPVGCQQCGGLLGVRPVDNVEEFSLDDLQVLLSCHVAVVGKESPTQKQQEKNSTVFFHNHAFLLVWMPEHPEMKYTVFFSVCPSYRRARKGILEHKRRNNGRCCCVDSENK